MLLALIRRYIQPYRGAAGWVVLFQITATAMSLTLPNLNAKIIDEGVSKGDTGYILTHGTLMLGVSLAQTACQVAAVFLAAKIAMGMGRDIRAEVFAHSLTFSRHDINHFGAPSLLTRTTNDVQQVQTLVFMTCAMMLSAPLTMAGGLVMALRQDTTLSWLILVAVLVLGCFIGILVFRLTPLFQAQQAQIDTMNQVVREQISGIRVVRAFTREPAELARFDTTNTGLRDLQMSIGAAFSMLFPFVHLVMNLGNVGVMWFGAIRIADGAIQIGQLTAFITYLIQILMSVILATMMAMLGPRAEVCARRIREVLDTESSIRRARDALTELPERGTVRFHQVTFTHAGADRPVLDNISFEMTPGTITAVVGSTGSGKSTLANLIPRLADVTTGRVCVDGVEVTRIDQESLWSRIGLVPQQPYLFSGTIRSNLQDGCPEATDEEMWQALRVAQADDFVAAMPDGLDSAISQGGTNVSGGQRQRLSIARALIKKPEIYVFDDAFSALDVATDARLRAALLSTITDAAVLIIAQRVSTIQNADQIIVLEAGRIVGIGTHQNLLDECPTYQEIVASQLSLEEAA